ncbi:MAG: DUF4224 domain-containing protein [Alcanivorax sp.]|nr:DUF4224 domain-containing protein [Alcanivorax sp.]
MITDELLSYDEAKALTGYKRVSDQESYLKGRGVPCWVNREGTLIAMREAARTALGAPTGQTQGKPDDPEDRLHIDEVA